MCHFVRLLKNNLEWHIFRSIIYTNKDLNFNIKMTKDFLKTFFGIADEAEFEKIINDTAKLVKKLTDEYYEEKDKKSDAETYYKESKKEYNNGELVKKSEKEYVNGECTKNEEFDSTKQDGSDCGCVHNKCKCDEPTLESLIKKNEELTRQNQDLIRYIDKFNNKIIELEKKNTELNVVINNVKKCF